MEKRWSEGCIEHKRKCEGCPFREFVPLDEAVIRRHLDKDAKETDVIGIYPILEDNTVYFLCADFDDKNCESLQYMKGTLAKALQSLGIRGVECCIIIRKPSSRDEVFIQAGVKLVQTEEQIIRAAVIDRSLLWFGSIDLAGTHHREEDNVMRVLAPVIASEMLGYIM